MAINVAVLHLRHGETAAAAAIIQQALPFAPEGSDARTRLLQLTAATERMRGKG